MAYSDMRHLIMAAFLNYILGRHILGFWNKNLRRLIARPNHRHETWRMSFLALCFAAVVYLAACRK